MAEDESPRGSVRIENITWVEAEEGVSEQEGAPTQTRWRRA
jgi:hypothetical protein